jgi:hypothetical protein
MTNMTTNINIRGAAALFAAALLALGCEGTVATTGDGDDDPGGELVPASCTVQGPRMTRRLTNLQLHNTLQAVFQDPDVPSGDVLTDPVVHGFKVDATQAVVRDLGAQLIMSYAETVADWAVTQKLGQLSPCQSTDDACVRALVESLGKKLYREPVSAESVDAYVAMFAVEPTFADGARAMIAAMLQSPYVLYRRELGTLGDDGLYHLTPYELASSLSYMLTNGPPDDALMAAAEQGQLASPADLDREVARLLDTPASATAFGTFARDWLVIDDVASRAKLDPTNQLTDAVRNAMPEETARLFVDVLRSGASIAELYTASYTFIDQTLASYYQLGGAGGGFERVELPDGSRGRGILGHGSILTRHALADSSSPVQRGKLVRERLLCEELAPPPPSVDANLPPPMGAMTTRQRYDQHAQSDFCATCHVLMDPVGFAFEHFDGFGRKRDQENGIPIDSTGTLAGMDEGDIPLDGLDSLSSYLATSPQATACLVRYMAYNAYGLEDCSVDEIDAELAASDGSLESVVLALVHAPQFATRTAD